MDEEEEVVTVNVWRRRLKTMTIDDGGNADQDNVRMKTLKMTARRELAATTTSLPLLLFCEGEINAFTATRGRLRETRCALKSAGVPFPSVCVEERLEIHAVYGETVRESYRDLFSHFSAFYKMASNVRENYAHVFSSLTRTRVAILGENRVFSPHRESYGFPSFGCGSGGKDGAFPSVSNSLYGESDSRHRTEIDYAR